MKTWTTGSIDVVCWPIDTRYVAEDGRAYVSNAIYQKSRRFLNFR